MNIFNRIFQARDKPEDMRRAQDALGGSRFSFFFGSSTSGKPVNERTAMQMTAVYSCVRILSEAVAGLPLHVYRYTEKGSKRIVDFTLFERYLVEDVMPFVERRYRAGGSKEKRAMAGLSMGSLQTSMVGFRYPELFSALGIFSGFLHDWIQGSELDMVKRGSGDDSHLIFLNDRERFDQAFRVFFRAMGDEDPFWSYFKEDDERCEKAGIRQERRVYEGTHDWNVWRQCIRDFAQLIFR